MTTTDVDVEVTAVTSTRRPLRRSMLESIAAIDRLIVAQARRAREGDGGLAELAALAALESVLAAAIDDVATYLLEHDDASYREVGIALGIGKPGALKRYPGASARPPGGQRADLR